MRVNTHLQAQLSTVYNVQYEQKVTSFLAGTQTLQMG